MEAVMRWREIEIEMQSGKKAMESMKESAANVAASAKAGMDKTKATVQEKVFFSPHFHFFSF